MFYYEYRFQVLTIDRQSNKTDNKPQ